MSEKGLLMVHTGNGKGKTTAALGVAFRMLGHHEKVAIVQFIKGSWKYGELVSAERHSDLLDVHVMGRGFTFKSTDRDADVMAARRGWELAEKIIDAGEHRLVILDELTYLVSLEMIPEADVLDVLSRKPPGVHVVITGRDASEKMMAMADLVTEMKEIKHPFKSGIKAQRGIEY